MSKEEILYEVKDKKAYISLNRQERRNALNDVMIDSIVSRLAAVKDDDEIRVVCLASSGGKHFCSGGDLTGMMGSSGGAAEAMKKYADILKEVVRFPKPLVCKLNGNAYGGGIGLMLACDIIIARSDVRIGTPEVNVGVFPMMIGALIYRNAVWKKAMKMILMGDKVNAHEAESMGLVSQVVEPDRFDEEVEKVLDNLAQKSPIAIKLGKEAFHAMSDMKFEDALDHLCESLQKVVSTEDAFEGISAFMEKRKPNFKGK